MDGCVLAVQQRRLLLLLQLQRRLAYGAVGTQ